MDHFFQIRGVGKPRGADARGLDDARASWRRTTKRARLGLMVGGVHYRNPALWVKAATTLDVLSGGRAWLGIGAAWNEEESRAPRLPVPAARRALRDARGDAPDRPRDVGGRARQRGGVPGPAVPGGAPAQLPAVAVAPAGPDHDRRRRREEDAPPGGPVRRRDATSSASPEAIARKYAILDRALRRGRPRPERDRALDPPERGDLRATAAAGRRRRHRSSTASASSPTPAPST